MPGRMLKYLGLWVGAFLWSSMVFSQTEALTDIKKALEDKHIMQAKEILENSLKNLKVAGMPDSLVQYIFISGEVYQQIGGRALALKKVNSLVADIQKMQGASLILKMQANIEAGEFFGSAGANKDGYRANLEAQKFLEPGKEDHLPSWALTENNLSTFANLNGNLALSKIHGKKSLDYLLLQKSPDPEKLYFAYNNMGSAHWYSAHLDSASYYYNLALKALVKAGKSALNQYYRPAILYNNLSAIYQNQGNTSRAVQAMEKTISNLQRFLLTDLPLNKKKAALSFQYEAMDNLGGIYKDLGDLRKAKDLLEYSYQKKQETLPKDHPGIYISRIILGQLYYAMHDFEKASDFLLSGLSMIREAAGNHLFWEADAYSTLAMIAEEKNEIQRASLFFEKADSLYEQSLQGAYDVSYLSFLRNAALFYAQNGLSQRAFAKAHKSYAYVVKQQGPGSLSAFNELLNLADISFESKMPAETIKWADKALHVLKNIRQSGKLLDSIKTELKKPKVILRRGKASYQLAANKPEKYIRGLLLEMEQALSILDRQKSILTNPEDIGFLVADHSELLDFIKHLTYDLYKISGDDTLIDKLISYHEGGIYQRIRSRLDKSDSLHFLHLSKDVLQQEKALKQAIDQALAENIKDGEQLNLYLSAVKAFDHFRQNLKEKYPQYYQIKYASLFKPLNLLQNEMPDNSSIIRYFFIQKELYALILGKGVKKLIRLNAEKLNERVQIIGNHMEKENMVVPVFKDLFDQLWQPLEKYISGRKVVIVPDGVLFNLNFELLTSRKPTGYNDLANAALLHRYIFSYQYSLFVYQSADVVFEAKDSYVAFAPGFSGRLKKSASLSAEELLNENAYLNLLPQPFSLDLAKRSLRLLGGKAFLEERSTVRAFKENAGKHQIIYIGTHAEFNNDNPSYSRLFFARDPHAAGAGHFLYLDDLYNYDLTSELTLLTACETGKPGYKDGEGMISLAHAFNYAGSKSILTGLWKIDEQASAWILEVFYRNLVEGLPKDEALQQAKLSYLKKARGRMLEPQYWAGLVILGDTDSVVFEKPLKYLFYLVPAGVLLLFTGIFFYRRNQLNKLKIKKFGCNESHC